MIMMWFLFFILTLSFIAEELGEVSSAQQEEEKESHQMSGDGMEPAEPSAGQDSFTTPESIAQIDGLCGLDSCDSDSESEDELIRQIDGSSEGRRLVCEPGPGPAFKVLTGPVCSSLLFVANRAPSADSDANTPPSSASTSAATRPGEASAPPIGVAAIRQVKRERSDSNESSDGGDRPTKKTHQCHFCNKLFANSFRLKIHVRVHTGEKPFKCEPCNQAFSDRSNFVKHKQTRTHRSKADPTGEGEAASTLSEQASRLSEVAATQPPDRLHTSGEEPRHSSLVSFVFFLYRYR